MLISNLVREITLKKSLLCVGLDTDPLKIPESIRHQEDAVFSFNKSIIDATAPYSVAYKINTAFYEAQGVTGWQSLARTISYLNNKYPEIYSIADAKRGDIGNTSDNYARAFFKTMNFDAITVAPYMGEDSINSFLRYENKNTILLALTSNKGAYDFQTEILREDNIPLYQQIIIKSQGWQHSERLIYVVGATKSKHLSDIRRIIPNTFLLIPGVGAQSGSLEEVCHYGLNSTFGLLINSSRAIIYASSSDDFAESAAKEAQSIQRKMEEILSKRNQ